MKNQNRVHGDRDSKRGGAQALRQTTTQARTGLKTYRVFTARAGETDMTKWSETGQIQARSPLAAARRQLREFKRVAVCRFTKGETDYIFDLVKGKGATPASAGEGVTLAFFSHAADEKFADVAYTAAEFAAIQQAARKLNLTLEEFFNRALVGAVAAAPPAPAPSAAPPGVPVPVVLLWPAQIAGELHAAQRELDHAADAAVALALMNAESIKEDVKGSAEWEDLALPRFDFGAVELARMAAGQISAALERHDDSLNQLAGEVEARTEPVATLPDARSLTAAIELRRPLDTSGAESAVAFMSHCLTAQGAVMCDRGSGDSLAASLAVNARLDAAWRAVLTQSNRLVDAVLAVRAQPQTDERMAA